MSSYRRPLLGTGVCGGLTTFSTMQVEIVRDAGRAPRRPGARIHGGEPGGRLRGDPDRHRRWCVACGCAREPGGVGGRRPHRWLRRGPAVPRRRGGVRTARPLLPLRHPDRQSLGGRGARLADRARPRPRGSSARRHGRGRLVHHVLHVDVRDPTSRRGPPGAPSGREPGRQPGGRRRRSPRPAGGRGRTCDRGLPEAHHLLRRAAPDRRAVPGRRAGGPVRTARRRRQHPPARRRGLRAQAPPALGPAAEPVGGPAGGVGGDRHPAPGRGGARRAARACSRPA